jgi:hypothetical protein
MWQAHRIFRDLEWLKTHFSNSTSYSNYQIRFGSSQCSRWNPVHRSRKSPTKTSTYYNDRFSLDLNPR